MVEVVVCGIYHSRHTSIEVHSWTKAKEETRPLYLVYV